MDLTSRQQNLLFVIIEEFIRTADAVGSISLQNKYNFDVSPATIRNEMANLVAKGYLFQKHNSGGRIPTTKGWRFFIEELYRRKLHDLDQRIKNRISVELERIRKDKSVLIKEAIAYLAELSENAAIALLDQDIYYAGLSELIDIPEFREHENLKQILKILEDYYTLSQILNKHNTDGEVNILIGEETGLNAFEDYAIIFSEIIIEGDKKGFVAVIGPNRMRYSKVIPSVKYISDTVRLLLRS